MKKITVSAPGKLMLFGEHAVIYGRPCIVTAVGQRMRATVELTDEPTFQLEAPDVKVTDYKKAIEEVGIGEIPKGAKFVEVAVKNFLDKYPFGGGVKVETDSEFSSAFGFGSSSASTVCVVKALAELTGAKLDKKAIFELAYKTVLDIQGKGSGFDVAAAIFGGTLYYITPGKVIEPLNIDSLPLIVGYSGLKFDTVTLVNQVSKLSEKYPKVIENVYSQIEKLVEQAKITLVNEQSSSTNKDWQTLGELMNFNEGLLSVLGVEGKKLADMIYGARDAGAYGAKLSGSGIGDCMIALSPEEKKKAVEKAITEAEGKVIDVETNVEGVKVEK